MQDHDTLSITYQRLWDQALTHYRASGVAVDTYLPHKHADSRRGLTLMARLPYGVDQTIRGFMEEFDQLVPGQYVYPTSDLHITLMTLIGCAADFVWKVEDWPLYWNR
ncbi:MAG: hypothetical protein AAFV07_09370, partial [Bacteroidota bacterium]